MVFVRILEDPLPMWNRFPLCAMSGYAPPMFRPQVLAWACLSLTLTGCIQRQWGSSASGTDASGAASTSDGASQTLGGQAVLASSGVKAFELSGDVQKVTLSDVTVTGQPFTNAVRAEIKQGSNNEW